MARTEVKDLAKFSCCTIVSLGKGANNFELIVPSSRTRFSSWYLRLARYSSGDSFTKTISAKKKTQTSKVLVVSAIQHQAYRSEQHLH